MERQLRVLQNQRRASTAENNTATTAAAGERLSDLILEQATDRGRRFSSGARPDDGDTSRHALRALDGGDFCEYLRLRHNKDLVEFLDGALGKSAASADGNTKASPQSRAYVIATIIDVLVEAHQGKKNVHNTPKSELQLFRSMLDAFLTPAARCRMGALIGLNASYT